MNISAQFKLQPPLEVLHVGLVRVLDNYLLGLDRLDVGHAAVGEFNSPDPCRDPRDGRNTRQGGDGGPSLEVDDVGHGLLSDNWNGAESELHHLAGEQLGPVSDKEAAHPLAAESAHSQWLRMICGQIKVVSKFNLLEFSDKSTTRRVVADLWCNVECPRNRIPSAEAWREPGRWLGRPALGLGQIPASPGQR